MITGFIRQATHEDISLLQHLKTVGALSAYGKKHEVIDIRRWLDINASQQYFEDALESGTEFFLSEQFGYSLAMASWKKDNHVARLGNLYCLVQGLGLGSSLIMYREQRALEAGCREARLNVWTTNTPAISFVVKNGFIPVDHFTDSVVGSSVIVFAKDLIP